MRKGFTLIELLVVVLIIGILAAVALPQYQRAVDKSRYTQVMVLLEHIWQAEQVYKMTNGNYATSLDDLAIDVPEYKGGNCFVHDTGYIACILALNNSSQTWYFAWPNSASRSCWAQPKENARANALCKAITRKTTGTENGIYMMYYF